MAVHFAYLSRARDAERRKQRICSLTTVRRENALDQRHNIRAVEDIELAGILLKDLCEAELFDRSPPVVGWIEANVCRRR